MFLIPIYAAAPDHSPSASLWLAFMELSCAHPHHFCLPSSNGRALTPEPGEVLCRHQSGTKCSVNFTASCYILVLVWVVWWRWLKVWGYWDTLVWEGKVGGKVLMRITSYGVPRYLPIEWSALSSMLLQPPHSLFWVIWLCIFSFEKCSRNWTSCALSHS